jgi:ABC-type polysaccharide/polyol phosphate transport system ATPase subunit
MNAIELAGVTKTYRLGVGRARVREMLPPPIDGFVSRVLPGWWSRDLFNALERVTLAISAGAAVGIVGHNGAGKTTLLKIVAGITSATKGSITIHGRVAALVDVLVGFHPDLTGRENLYLFAAMHGFNRRAMNRRISRVLDFAEIGEMADTPLKRYSAGMTSRLAFASIASMDADVLLIDEILAVGDASFQKRCVEWLREYRRNGGTLLFVSHNLGLVRSMTDRAIWLDHGEVVLQGKTAEVLEEYGRAMEHRSMEQRVHKHSDANKAMVTRGLYRWGTGGAHVVQVHVRHPAESPGTIELEVSFRTEEPQQVVLCVGFVDEGGREVGVSQSPTLPVNGDEAVASCAIAPMTLRPGLYFPIVAVLGADGVVHDRWRLERAVVVEATNELLGHSVGPVVFPAEWSFDISPTSATSSSGRGAGIARNSNEPGLL